MSPSSGLQLVANEAGRIASTRPASPQYRFQTAPSSSRRPDQRAFQGDLVAATPFLDGPSMLDPRAHSANNGAIVLGRQRFADGTFAEGVQAYGVERRKHGLIANFTRPSSSLRAASR